MALKPTEKQLDYISYIERCKFGVPSFTGITRQDASEYIRKYKDAPTYIGEDDAELMLPDIGYYV